PRSTDPTISRSGTTHATVRAGGRRVVSTGSARASARRSSTRRACRARAASNAARGSGPSTGSASRRAASHGTSTSVTSIATYSGTVIVRTSLAGRTPWRGGRLPVRLLRSSASAGLVPVGDRGQALRDRHQRQRLDRVPGARLHLRGDLGRLVRKLVSSHAD